MNGVIFHRDDDAAQSAAGGYPVARLKLIDHLLPFLLLFLLGHDQQQVEDGKNKDHRQEQRAHTAAAHLKEKQAYLVLNHFMTGPPHGLTHTPAPAGERFIL